MWRDMLNRLNAEVTLEVAHLRILISEGVMGQHTWTHTLTLICKHTRTHTCIHA